jgi:hypothetical protein
MRAATFERIQLRRLIHSPHAGGIWHQTDAKKPQITFPLVKQCGFVDTICSLIILAELPLPTRPFHAHTP